MFAEERRLGLRCYEKLMSKINSSPLFRLVRGKPGRGVFITQYKSIRTNYVIRWAYFAQSRSIVSYIINQARYIYS